MEAKKSPKANLENKKIVFLEIGFILSLLIVFAAFGYRTYDKVGYNPAVSLTDNTLEERIPITVQPVKTPPPPPKSNPKINIVDDNKYIPDDPDIDVAATGKTEVPIWEPPPQKVEVIPEPDLYIVAEQDPQFPGGMEAMYQYLNNTIKYPRAAREIGISGTVFLNFVVEKDGSISSVNVLRGIGGGCDEEAIRVVQNMPKWNPGLQRGEPVRVSFNLPVKFTLH
jgi:periplasmic protein TonB